MLKILLLDCSKSLHEKLTRQGFDVEAGTAGICTGVRKLPSQVYEKDLIFYNPELPTGTEQYFTSNPEDETPQFSLVHLGNQIEAGITVVVFANHLSDSIKIQNLLYSWIPFMPQLSFTHDKIVMGRSFREYPDSEFKAYAPLIQIGELSIPVLVKLLPPPRNQNVFVPDVLDFFWNGKGDCLGVIIRRKFGSLIVLPRFNSNEELIEVFLHRVAPRIYRTTTNIGLIDSYSSPNEKEARTKVQRLIDAEKEIVAQLGEARGLFSSATREKERVINGDETAKQILTYYELARRQDESALFYLYKIIEAIENKFGGEFQGIKAVGPATEWKAVKRLANESYRDARHPPKPGEIVKKWTAAEIKECFKNTETVVRAYFETLFKS